MSGKKAFVSSVAVALIVFGAASEALAGSERWPRGGFVKACSLDGVNPVYHPGIFGNPAIARSLALSDGGMGLGALWATVTFTEVRSKPTRPGRYSAVITRGSFHDR
jgi:hypothetical protein